MFSVLFLLTSFFASAAVTLCPSTIVQKKADFLRPVQEVAFWKTTSSFEYSEVDFQNKIVTADLRAWIYNVQRWNSLTEKGRYELGANLNRYLEEVPTEDTAAFFRKLNNELGLLDSQIREVRANLIQEIQNKNRRQEEVLTERHAIESDRVSDGFLLYRIWYSATQDEQENKLKALELESPALTQEISLAEEKLDAVRVKLRQIGVIQFLLEQFTESKIQALVSHPIFTSQYFDRQTVEARSQKALLLYLSLVEFLIHEKNLSDSEIENIKIAVSGLN